MKYIFDFDDTLFDTKKFKEHMFSVLENAGISRSVAEGKYSAEKKSKKLFSLEDFISELFSKDTHDAFVHNLYEEIMVDCSKFVKPEFRRALERVGKENCYIATQGEDEFQRDKIRRAGLLDLVTMTHTTKHSKFDIVKEICDKFKNESVVFIDNKEEHLDELRKGGIPNLTTINTNDPGFLKLMKEGLLGVSEIKRK